MLIQHIALAGEWAAARAAGSYDRSTRGASIGQVGFLHASDGPVQVATVLAAVYADVTEPLVLLTLDPAALHRAGLRIALEPGDPARPEGEWFPHVYGGPIPVGAVADVVPLSRVPGSGGGAGEPGTTPAPSPHAVPSPPAVPDAAQRVMDEAHLGRSIDLATANVAGGGGPFGAVLVTADGQVFTGVNRVAATQDPTAHAEVEAIRAAAAATGDADLSGAVVYASCEPCPMCVAASVWARVERIVFAADRHDAAAAGFSDTALYDHFGLPGGTDPAGADSAADSAEGHRMEVTRMDMDRALEPFAASPRQ